MKTTEDLATEWYDKASEVILFIILLPVIILCVICYTPFWVPAKIYTKWFQKENK